MGAEGPLDRMGGLSDDSETAGALKRELCLGLADSAHAEAAKQRLGLEGGED